MASFTDTEREVAMRAIVLAQGNIRRARQALLSQDIDVSESHLRRWRRSPRYAELESDRDWYFEDAAESAEGLADLGLSATTRLIRLIMDMPDEELAKQDVQKLSAAAHNVSKVANSSLDKSLTLRGRPTKITQSQDLPTLLRVIAREFGDVIPGIKEHPLLESTAEEIPAGAP